MPTESSALPATSSRATMSPSRRRVPLSLLARSSCVLLVGRGLFASEFSLALTRALCLLKQVTKVFQKKILTKRALRELKCVHSPSNVHRPPQPADTLALVTAQASPPLPRPQERTLRSLPPGCRNSRGRTSPRRFYQADFPLHAARSPACTTSTSSTRSTLTRSTCTRSAWRQTCTPSCVVSPDASRPPTRR